MGWNFYYTWPVSFDHSQTTRRRDHQLPWSANKTFLRQRSCFSFEAVTWNLQSDGHSQSVNHSLSNPQTNGLVGHFHRTLTPVLSKTTQPGGMDWEDRLLYILFAYNCSEQESIQDLLFSWSMDVIQYYPQMKLFQNLHIVATMMLMTLALRSSLISKMLDLKLRGMLNMLQKKQHDKKARMPTFSEGDRVFVFKPAAKSCKFTNSQGPFMVCIGLSNFITMELTFDLLIDLKKHQYVFCSIDCECAQKIFKPELATQECAVYFRSSCTERYNRIHSSISARRDHCHSYCPYSVGRSAALTFFARTSHTII